MKDICFLTVAGVCCLVRDFVSVIMSLDEKFNAAAEAVKSMKSRPTDAELLELYALFKQATCGDCNTDKPGLIDLKGKAKWEAWSGKKGMGADAAKEAYVSYANTLVTKY